MMVLVVWIERSAFRRNAQYVFHLEERQSEWNLQCIKWDCIRAH